MTYLKKRSVVNDREITVQPQVKLRDKSRGSHKLSTMAEYQLLVKSSKSTT